MKRKRGTTSDMMLSKAVKAMVVREADELDHILIHDVDLQNPSYIALPVAVLNSQGVEVGRCDHLPPIRCTMPVPCGVCWYCKQHEVRQ